mgnify:CR=1 FL=1
MKKTTMSDIERMYTEKILKAYPKWHLSATLIGCWIAFTGCFLLMNTFLFYPFVLLGFFIMISSSLVVCYKMLSNNLKC